MKGSEIKKVLMNFSPKERSDFRTHLQGNSNEKKFLAFTKFLVKDDYSEIGAIEVLGVSKRTKHKLLAEFGELIISFLVGRIESTGIGGKLELARRLASAMIEGLAITLLYEAMAAAWQLENYQLVLDGWKIAGLLDSKVEFFHISMDEVNRRLIEYSKLELLYSEIWKARKIDSDSERTMKLLALREECLDTYSASRIGKRSELVFFRSLALIDNFLQDREGWILSQEALVAHLKESQWICIDPEYEIAKETRILLLMYLNLGYREKYLEVLNEFNNMTLISSLARFERFYLKFPFALIESMEAGDIVSGAKIANEFVELEKSGSFANKPKFASWNLYWCAYYYISVRKIKGASKVMVRLRKIGRTMFIPSILSMAVILEVVIAFENNELEDVERHLRNAKHALMANPVRGGIESLKTFRLFRKVLENPGQPKLMAQLQASIEIVRNKDVSKYFDIPIWVESFMEKCPMQEKFQHRANWEVR